MRRSFLASASATTNVPRRWRLRLRVLLVRMCDLNAFARMILPAPVFLNRLAAPRCDFSFGMALLGCGFLFRGGLLAHPLRQNRVHLVAFLPRRGLGDRHLGQVVDEPFQDAPPDLGMRHLAAAEEYRRFHLVAVGEKALDVLLLELVVVLVDLRAVLDLLDLDDLLVLLGLARALLLLVLIAPEVHDPADRRVRRRRDLDQVEPLLLGNHERLLRRHDAELLAGVVDDPDLAHPDPFVPPRAVVSPRASLGSYNCLLTV